MENLTDKEINKIIKTVKASVEDGEISDVIKSNSKEEKNKDLNNIKTDTELFALFVHSIFLYYNFVLIGFHENEDIDRPITLYELRSLPKLWKSGANLNDYQFRYTHQSLGLNEAIKREREISVRILRLGDKTMIAAVSTGNLNDSQNSTKTLDLSPRQYLNNENLNMFPINNNNISNIESFFISPSLNTIKSLISSIISQIINPLIKFNLNNLSSQSSLPTYSNEDNNSSRSSDFSDMTAKFPLNDPIYTQNSYLRSGTGMDPPGFEDDYQILSTPSSNGGNLRYQPPPSHPLSIGSDDLNPPGLGRDPLMVSGIYPPLYGNHRGMFPALDDPVFQNNDNSGYETHNSDQGRNPITRPPGSRWDDPTAGGSNSRFGPSFGGGTNNFGPGGGFF